MDTAFLESRADVKLLYTCFLCSDTLLRAEGMVSMCFVIFFFTLELDCAFKEDCDHLKKLPDMAFLFAVSKIWVMCGYLGQPCKG